MLNPLITGSGLETGMSKHSLDVDNQTDSYLIAIMNYSVSKKRIENRISPIFKERVKCFLPIKVSVNRKVGGSSPPRGVAF